MNGQKGRGLIAGFSLAVMLVVSLFLTACGGHENLRVDAGGGDVEVVRARVTVQPDVWVDEPSALHSDGSARVVNSASPLFTSEMTENEAVHNGTIKLAKMIGGTELWAENSRFMRAALSAVAKDLNLDERFLRDASYSLTHVKLDSVVVSRRWFDRDGVRGEPGSVFVELLCPGPAFVAALLRAKAQEVEARLQEAKMRKGKAFADELEPRATVAIERMMDRAAAIEAGKDPQ